MSDPEQLASDTQVLRGPTECVVMFSGGLGSYWAARRAVARFGAAHTALLFTDTTDEDPDLYRFLAEAAADVGCEVVNLADGRNVWEVFRDEQSIGNTRRDPCSKILKRLPSRRWLAANRDPAITCLAFGIGWQEDHRYDGDPMPLSDQRRGVKNVYGRLGWPHVWAPLLETPWMTDLDLQQATEARGIRIPALYRLGFQHNNCGGFCVKAGAGQFAHLLRVLPQRYAYHEAQEEAFNAARPGKRRQTVLAPEVRQPDGKMKRVPISMREFRERLAAADDSIDLFDFGGCGCFLDEAA